MKKPSPPNVPAFSKTLSILGSFGLSLTAMSQPALAEEWTNGGVTNNWSDLANWDSNPANGNVIFGETGTTATPAIPTNIVDADITLQSLTYQYDSTSVSHVTEITAGTTLNIIGGAGNDLLLVGGLVSDASPWRTYHTTAAIRGAGSLVLTGEGKNVTISNHRFAEVYNAPPTATLDLRGLSSFSANLGAAGSLNLGAPPLTGSGNRASTSYLYLAQNNSITAGTIRVGSAIDAAASVSVDHPSELALGESTELNVTEFLVGVGRGSRASGKVYFDPSALPNDPTLVMRGLDGSSAVTEIAIGANKRAASSTTQLGEVDFTGGEVDILATTITIGSGRGVNLSAGAYAGGVLTMDQGIIKATEVVVGETLSGSPANAINRGVLNVDGGRFEADEVFVARRVLDAGKVTGTMNISGTAEVNVGAGGIKLGSGATGDAGDTIVAQLNVLGGTLNSAGDIGRGHANPAISSSLLLGGGEINLQGNAIDVTSLELESGTLRNIGEINGGANIVKTTAGALTLAGFNSYTGETHVSEGTLRVDGTLENSQVIVGSGATLTGNGGVINSVASLDAGATVLFDLRAADDYNSLEIFSLILGEGGNLEINLDYAVGAGERFTLLQGGYTGAFASINDQEFGAGNSFELSFGGTDYQFNLSYGAGEITIQAIPEPGTFALMGLAGLGLLVARRRRR